MPLVGSKETISSRPLRFDVCIVERGKLERGRIALIRCCYHSFRRVPLIWNPLSHSDGIFHQDLCFALTPFSEYRPERHCPWTAGFNQAKAHVLLTTREDRRLVRIGSLRRKWCFLMAILSASLCLYANHKAAIIITVMILIAMTIEATWEFTCNGIPITSSAQDHGTAFSTPWYVSNQTNVLHVICDRLPTFEQTLGMAKNWIQVAIEYAIITLKVIDKTWECFEEQQIVPQPTEMNQCSILRIASNFIMIRQSVSKCRSLPSSNKSVKLIPTNLAWQIYVIASKSRYNNSVSLFLMQIRAFQQMGCNCLATAKQKDPRLGHTAYQEQTKPIGQSYEDSDVQFEPRSMGFAIKDSKLYHILLLSPKQ